MNQLRKELVSYQKEKPQFKELLNLYSGILDVQQQCLSTITAQTKLPDEKIKTLLDQGQYLLKEHPIRIDEKQLKQITDELKGLFAKQQGVLKSSPSETETLIASYAMAPFYQKESVSLKEKMDASEWLKGFCPVCGQFPRISKLRKEDGKRVLQCPLCLTEWIFARIGCPYCDNVDSSSLDYFYEEDDRARRINVCGKCKTYIKTVDERLLKKDVSLEIEDVITPQLNELVEKKGYHPLHHNPDGPS